MRTNLDLDVKPSNARTGLVSLNARLEIHLGAIGVKEDWSGYVEVQRSWDEGVWFANDMVSVADELPFDWFCLNGSVNIEHCAIVMIDGCVGYSLGQSETPCLECMNVTKHTELCLHETDPVRIDPHGFVHQLKRYKVNLRHTLLALSMEPVESCIFTFLQRR